MIKGLEAFNRINNKSLHLYMHLYEGYEYQQDLSIIEKELKALEIIIEYQVHPEEIIESYNYERYQNIMLNRWWHLPHKCDKKQWFDCYVLNEEDFTIVKEVLGDE